LLLLLFDGVNQHRAHLVVLDAFDLASLVAEGEQRFDSFYFLSA